MPLYLVKWKIDIEAKSPKEAAERAFEIQRDPESIATVFEVLGSRGKTGRKIYVGTFDLKND